MIGKIVPYIVVGAGAGGDHPADRRGCCSACRWRAAGRPALLGTALFITGNLALGFTISTVAQNQLQAMQMTFFFLLPSILLSGFMFPFRGMPAWAQWLGEVLPVTHFLRIVRGVMLKGAGFGRHLRASWRRCWRILLVVSTLAISRYRVTLD